VLALVMELVEGENLAERIRRGAIPLEEVLAQGTQPRYALSGHLLFAQSGTLMAAPFDPRPLALTGSAVPVLEGVLQTNTTGAAQYDLSSPGTLVYVAGKLADGKSRLV
jgi:hypothetical protein